MSAQRRGIGFWIGAITLGLYLAAGLSWTALNLRDIPHYGDTITYLRLGRSLRVDEFRGILYPSLLAVAGRLFLEGEPPAQIAWKAEESEGAGGKCAAPAGLASVQVLQILLCAGAIGYFLSVMTRNGSSFADGKRGWTSTSSLLLSGLLLFDPLVSHYNLSLMTDSLAFSAALVFCAALVDLGFPHHSLRTSSILLFVAYAVAAGLRVEKRWVLWAAMAATLGFWTFLRRRDLVRFPDDFSKRVLLAFGLTSTGLLLTIGAHDLFYKRYQWWPPIETALHFRLIFPHLSEVYEDLPESAKDYISPESARIYDRSVNQARGVIDRVTGGDDALRGRLTDDLVKTVLPRKWQVIAFDIAGDTLKNVFASISFYSRIVTTRLLEFRFLNRWFYSDASEWNYQRFVFHHPRFSVAYMVLFGVFFVFSLPFALRHALSAWRRGGVLRDRCPVLALWAPALAFWLLNAFAFAASVNITNVRYMIFSHALFLLLVYRPALRWLVQAAASRDSGPPWSGDR